MKRVGLALVGLLSIINLSSCSNDIIATEEVIEKEYKIENVDELLVKNIILKKGINTLRPNLYLLDGDESKVVIKTNNDLQKRIKVIKNEDCLQILGSKFENYVTETLDIYIYNYNFSEIDLSSVKATIDSSSLSSDDISIDLYGAASLELESHICDDFDVDLSGASFLEVDNISCNKFDISVSGASALKTKIVNANLESDIDISGASQFSSDILNTKEVKIDISGASKGEFKGTGEKLTADVSGASKLETLDFVSNDAICGASGASTIKVKFINSLKANVSGASTIYYDGDSSKVEANDSVDSKVIKI